MKAREVIAIMARRRSWLYGAELGVWQGETLFYLLEHCPDLSMVGVDRWERTPGPDKSKETGQQSYAEKNMEGAFQQVLEKREEYDGRCRIIRGDTVEAAGLFADRYFDFVFVDADHSEDGVRGDIQAWRKKVRAGGVMFGHDEDWPSVRRALKTEFGTWTKLDGNMWKVPA